MERHIDWEIKNETSLNEWHITPLIGVYKDWQELRIGFGWLCFKIAIIRTDWDSVPF